MSIVTSADPWRRPTRLFALVAVAVVAAAGCAGEGAGGACPSACTGGCDASGVCTIDCASPGACAERAIVCPDGRDCVVECRGLDACDSGRIRCPAGGTCTIWCSGVDGCGDQTIACGAAEACTMHCSDDRSSCTGATVECGAGPCGSLCEGSSGPYQMLGCDAASTCTRCDDAPADDDAGADADAAAGPDASDGAGDGATDADADDARDVDPSTVDAETARGWIEDYAATHEGRTRDINALSDSQLAANAEARRLVGLCGPDQRPVIPLLAWEYGGFDHAWISPDASALAYCVYIPVVPSTDHWSFDGDRVVADVWIRFPGENPCRDETGADRVAACIGDPSNFEILVDTASLRDGRDVGLDLSEAATELYLLDPGGGRGHLHTDL